VVALILLADRRFKLGHGRAFFLYVAAYTAGRAWIENMRIDTVNHIFGLRLNVWTAIILFVLAVVAFVISAKRYPGQEDIATGPAAGKPADAEKDVTEQSDATEPGEAKADAGAEADAAPSETGGGDSNSASAEPAGGPAAGATTARANDGSSD
jgi:hypothetical protein